MNSRQVWQFTSSDARDALANCRTFVQALERDGRAAFDPFAACLVYSELVSNVVDHAPGPIDIEVHVHEERVSMTVIDRGKGFVLRPSLPDDPLAETGRGLFLVSQFAEELTAGKGEDGAYYVRVTFAPVPG